MASKNDRPQIVFVNRCFVVRDDGKFLLIKRAGNDTHLAGRWECPGGKLDMGQDLRNAMEREVMEETGLLVEPTHRMCYVDGYVIGDDGSKYAGLPYVVIFSVTRIVGGRFKLSHEHQGCAWVTPAQALRYELTPEVQKAVIIMTNQLTQKTEEAA